jgi:hypothetical protein
MTPEGAGGEQQQQESSSGGGRTMGRCNSSESKAQAKARSFGNAQAKAHPG